MKYGRVKILLIHLFGALLFTVSSFSLPENSAKVNEKFDKFLVKNEFNGVILVAKNGKIVFKNAYGFADLNLTVPLTSKASFNLASVSKQFTATGIMILKERGKLKLDDAVFKYLPQFSYVKAISIRHLLNHTSGLPDIYRILNSSWDTSKIAGNKTLLDLFAKQNPKPLFKPGERMQYSNTGYIILASIIETVSNKSFEDYLDKNIFKPLKMKDTYVYHRNMKKYPRSKRVYGLMKEDKKIILNDLIYCDGMRGDGNVHSSVEDLFKWDLALYTEKLLKKETLQKMFTKGHLNSGSPFNYGFGWGVNNNPDTVSHGGSWVGFRSLIVRYLNTHDTIIVLINLFSPKVGNIVKEIKTRFKFK